MYRSALLILILALAGCRLTPAVEETYEKQNGLMQACEERVKSGELLGYYSSSDCKATALENSMKRVDYPYLDLLEAYTDEVRMLALEVDAGERPKEEAQQMMNEAYQAWLQAEYKRCEQDIHIQKGRDEGMLGKLAKINKFSCADVLSQ